MDILKCTTGDMDRLYEGDAWTWEGMTTDDDNLREIIKWFEENGCPLKKPEFWVMTGKQMNEYCGGLTGNNKYSDDLTILSIELDNITDCQKMILKKFEVLARWFSDIVDNNRAREKQ